MKIKKADFITLFIKGFVINVANIGVLFFWMTAVTFASKNFKFQELKILLFFIILLSFYLFTEFVKVLLAKKLKSRLSDKFINKTNVILAYIFMAFGVIIAFKQLLFNIFLTFLPFFNLFLASF